GTEGVDKVLVGLRIASRANPRCATARKMPLAASWIDPLAPAMVPRASGSLSTTCATHLSHSRNRYTGKTHAPGRDLPLDAPHNAAGPVALAAGAAHRRRGARGRWRAGNPRRDRRLAAEALHAARRGRQRHDAGPCR